MKAKIAMVTATLTLLLGAAAPARAVGPFEQCMIGAGCVFFDGAWYCSDPGAYSLCAPE